MTTGSDESATQGEGRPEFEFTGYVTAFIDLLGFSHRLAALDLLFEPDTSESAVLLKLKGSIGPVLNMRLGFEQMFYEMSGAGLRQLGSMTSAQARAYQKLRSPELTIQYVSDAVILSVRIRKDNSDAVYTGILRLFQSIAGMTLYMLAKGQLCRGGIEIGTGLALSDTEVIGSALAHAHRIEQKQAKYPRTVVGERLFHFLQDSAKPMRPDSAGIGTHLASSCLARLTSDTEDGRHFVDFLAPWCTSLFPTDDRFRLIDSIRKQLVAAREMPEIIEDCNIASKYRWLERYVESRIGGT